MNTITATAKFCHLAFKKGLTFAKIQQQIDSPEPLNPEETWRYWTTPQHDVVEWLAKNWPLTRSIPNILNEYLRQPHEVGIEAHYDVSNEFYKLWLDSTYRFYSCAMFTSPFDDLDQAQKNKANYLLHLLQPKPGEHILDLGCGWGGMLKAIRERTWEFDEKLQGTLHLLGLTLSKKQHQYVSNLGFNVMLKDFTLDDTPPNSWDKMISIGSLEHVRPEEMSKYQKTLFKALKPKGRAVHQFFSTDSDPYTTVMLGIQHFFPGSVLSEHKKIRQAMEEAGFDIESDTVDDYRPTLKAWFTNLSKNQDTALRLVDVHTYNKYLVFLASSWRFFNDGHAQLHRMLLVKP